jgi:hypothetical protein
VSCPYHALTFIFVRCFHLPNSVYDLGSIRESGALFVRKVAHAIDPNMYKLLPVDKPEDIPPILWPVEIKLSPVPNWTKTVEQYKLKAIKEHEKKIKKEKQEQLQHDKTDKTTDEKKNAADNGVDHHTTENDDDSGDKDDGNISEKKESL